MDCTFWKTKRAPGVSNMINLNQYENIIDFFNDVTSCFSSNIAFTSAGYSLTFQEVDSLSTQFATYLQQETTLKPGDRIAVQLPNILQYPVVTYGIFKAGMILVNINPLYTAREMKEQIVDSGSRAFVFIDMAGERLQSILNETPLEYLFQTSFADLFPQPARFFINFAIKHVKKLVKPFSLPAAMSLRTALQAGKKHDLTPVTARKDDLAVLQYTGGTTGKTKGAMLSHGNLLANMLQGQAVLQQRDHNGNPYILPGQESVITALPLYHIYAFTVHLMGFFSLGANNILIPNPRDINAFIKTLRKSHVTGFVGLNTLFCALLQHKDFDRCHLESLKITTSGGTALKGEVARQWREKTGCIISEGYGLTECSPIVSMNPMGHLCRQGTVGQAVPETAIKVIDPDSADELPQGQRGELCVKGPQVMSGYWNDYQASTDVLDSDGWLKTGDVAEINDEGFIRIVDRIKDVILVSGFNVYPNEVEDVISDHPDVLSCAAIGLPDEMTGEAIKVYIVPAKACLTKETINDYCKEQLTGYKVPKYVEFRRQLPMSTVGKVLRRQLRMEHEKNLHLTKNK